MTEEEKLTTEMYSLEERYRNMLSDRIEIKKDENGYNMNDIYIFPLWYFSENKKSRIGFLKKSIDKNTFIHDLDEARDFEKSFRSIKK